MLKQKIKAADPLSLLSVFGAALFFIACPLYLRQKYFHITSEKTLFFFAMSGLFTVCCLFRRHALRKRVRVPLVRKNSTDRFLLLFIGLAVVTCLTADSRFDALIGGKGRNMGLVMFLFIFLAYISVSRFVQFRTPVAVALGVGLLFVNTISFLQFCQLDPLSLYKGSAESTYRLFMSTFGNKDVYYSYLAMLVPFSMYLTFEAKARWEKIFWYTVDFVGLVGILICNCEGGYTCLALSFVFFLLAKCRDKRGLLVFLRILALLFFASALISCLQFKFSEANIRIEVITRLCLSPFFFGFGLPAVAVLYVLVKKKELTPRFFTVLRKTVVIASASAVAVLIGLFVYFTFVNKKAAIGAFNTFLRFGSRHWGNGRNVIWKHMLEIYAAMPFYKKLIGGGEDSIGLIMERYLPELFNASEVLEENAHNEFLQYLLTHGLFGLTAYLLFVVSAIRRGFREGGGYQRAAALGACCYLVQSSYNILQSLSTPLFFVLLALTQTKALAVPPVQVIGTAANAKKTRKKKRRVPEEPDDAPETPDEAPETPDDASEAPDDAPETPDEAPETPDDASEAPDDAPETPDEAPETPDDASEAPDEVPETPDEAPEAPETSDDTFETPEKTEDGAAASP